VSITDSIQEALASAENHQVEPRAAAAAAAADGIRKIGEGL